MPIRCDRNDARPLRTLQGGAASGSEPQRSPPPTTGGLSRPLWRARGRQRKATGGPNTSSLKLMHWNAEGISNKKGILENLLSKKNINVCCIQETHLKKETEFKIRGYQCFKECRTDRKKGGILTLVRNNIPVVEKTAHMEGAEYQKLQLQLKDTTFDLLNYYCPNDRPLSLHTVEVPSSKFIAVGDFNSHSQSWGFDHLDGRGEEVEEWQDDHQLVLINSPDDTPTFYSRRWRTTTTPDLAFATEDMASEISREVGEALVSDHRPVFLTINNKRIEESNPAPRWNYKKAKWKLFGHRTNELTKDIQVQGRDINKVVREMNTCILKAAHECIPRGARKNYKPYWNSQLQQLQDDMAEAREKAEKHPTDENHTLLQKSTATFLKAKLEARRRSWKEKTSSLNLEKDGNKLWKVVGQINDEGSGHTNITLEENGKILTHKQAADSFANQYAKESNIDITAEQQREARGEQRKRTKQSEGSDITNQCITLNEIQTALKKLKTKKSPGPDGITNEMLKHLGNVAVLKLLAIFNHSWTTGTLAQIWREAIMIPVYKKGKNKYNPASYRPISLTSCVVKTLERIINERLLWHLETERILVPEQAGFRRFRSTDDQATYLAQEIEDAFQEKKCLLAAWIDLQKAFDKVWKDGLLVKLQRSGITNNMLRWIKSYLHNRRARVTVNRHTGKKVLLRHGVPQGGVLSPTLFLIFINDLVEILPKGVNAALYADDLVLWCKEEYATTATYRVNQALERLHEWSQKWCVKINKEKSSTTLFTLSPKAETGKIKLGDTFLQTEEEVTYLGVTFDKRLTWRTHIEKAETKARRKLAIMRKLAGTSWGANAKILKQVYQGTVRPHLEYSSSAWSTAAPSHLKTLNKVQNQALRLITGAMSTTPIKTMEKTTNIQPLSDRRDAKILVQAEKLKSLQEQPMIKRMNRPTRSRLKSRSSFIRESRNLAQVHQVETPPTLPIKMTDLPQPWKEDHKELKISSHVPGVQGETQDTTAKRALTQALITDLYPSEAWIHAYTDGSARNAVSDGGAGIFIQSPEGQTIKKGFPTGKHCTNYTAEEEAIKHATVAVEELDTDCNQVVFLTDALSVLQALEGDKLPQLMQNLQKLQKRKRVALQWIPAHCGITGNEEADQLAKDGAAQPQVENSVNLKEKSTLIKATFRNTTAVDPYNSLTRQQQVAILRLRTGHCRLNAHMYKLKLATSPLCPCGTEKQTPEHVLQTCPIFSNLRQKTWPSDKSLHSKLYGSREELEDTTSFISQTELAL